MGRIFRDIPHNGTPRSSRKLAPLGTPRPHTPLAIAGPRAGGPTKNDAMVSVLAKTHGLISLPPSTFRYPLPRERSCLRLRRIGILSRIYGSESPFSRAPSSL